MALQVVKVGIDAALYYISRLLMALSIVKAVADGMAYLASAMPHAAKAWYALVWGGGQIYVQRI
jgi:hypothetical protein